MYFQRHAAGKSYWEGRAFFRASKTEVEVFVDGDENGVAPGAVEFYEEAQQRYQSVVTKFQPEIVRQLRGLSKEQFPADFESTCRVSSISVADTRLRREWSIGMDCFFDENLKITIEMDDWVNGTVVVDS